MTPLLLMLALTQSPSPAPAADAPAAPAPTAEQTLEGLQQVYSSTCGQTGILYHAYDDLCEGLRKQIRAYQVKVDHAPAAKATKAAAPALVKPQGQR